MGLISRVSSRTYRFVNHHACAKKKNTPKMSEMEQNEIIQEEQNQDWADGDAEGDEKNWDQEQGDEVQMQEILVFNKWSVEDVRCADLSLKDYINFKGVQHAKYLPHTAGRYNKIRFRKAQCPIIERLINSLMMHGRNKGKKMLSMRIVKHAFEIIFLLTGG